MEETRRKDSEEKLETERAVWESERNQLQETIIRLTGVEHEKQSLVKNFQEERENWLNLGSK